MAKKKDQPEMIPFPLLDVYRDSGDIGVEPDIQKQLDRFFDSHDPETAHEEVSAELMVVNYLRMVEAAKTTIALRTGDPAKDFDLAIKSERYISSIQRAYHRAAKSLMDAQKHRQAEERADQLLEARLQTEKEAQAHHDKIAAEMKETTVKRDKVLEVLIHDAPTLTDKQMLQNAVNAYYVRPMEDLGFVPHKYKMGPIDIKPLTN